MKRRFVLTVAILALSASALAGCGKKEKEPEWSGSADAGGTSAEGSVASGGESLSDGEGGLQEFGTEAETEPQTGTKIRTTYDYMLERFGVERGEIETEKENLVAAESVGANYDAASALDDWIEYADGELPDASGYEDFKPEPAESVSAPRKLDVLTEIAERLKELGYSLISDENVAAATDQEFLSVESFEEEVEKELVAEQERYAMMDRLRQYAESIGYAGDETTTPEGLMEREMGKFLADTTAGAYLEGWNAEGAKTYERYWNVMPAESEEALRKAIGTHFGYDALAEAIVRESGRPFTKEICEEEFENFEKCYGRVRTERIVSTYGKDFLVEYAKLAYAASLLQEP